MPAMHALRLPRWLTLVLALLLLGGQQAALAHMAGHIAGGAGTQVVAGQGDDEHGAALTLSHVCTTCIALDSFAAPLPALPQIALVETACGVAPAPTFSAPTLCPPRPYAARAPPLPL
jgi:hypothetical protein